MLRELASAQGSLGVASYGLSVTTLEEVFLRISADVSTENESTMKQPSAFSNVSTAPASNLSTQQAATPALNDASSRFNQNQTTQQQQHPGNGVYAASDQHSTHPGQHSASDSLLHGCALWFHQLKALVFKRMLCARRDRLAVLTQLLVPLLLVYIALWVSNLAVRSPEEVSLSVSRHICLRGQPVSLAATESVRNQTEYKGFINAYPVFETQETNQTALFRGALGPPVNDTLEGYLLRNWDGGQPSYDALYLSYLPPVEILTSGRGPPPEYTLLVNQSAISALPAAVNQANTAFLRMIVASGGSKRQTDGNSRDSSVIGGPASRSSTYHWPANSTAAWVQHITDSLPGADNGAGNVTWGSIRDTSRSRSSDAESPLGTGIIHDGKSCTAGDSSCGSRDSIVSLRHGDSNVSKTAGTGQHSILPAAASTLLLSAGSNSSNSSGNEPNSSTVTPAVRHTALSLGALKLSPNGINHWSLPSCIPTIKVTSHPLPVQREEPLMRMRQDAGSLMLVLCLTMASSVLSASFVVFLVR